MEVCRRENYGSAALVSEKTFGALANFFDGHARRILAMMIQKTGQSYRFYSKRFDDTDTQLAPGVGYRYSTEGATIPQ